MSCGRGSYHSARNERIWNGVRKGTRQSRHNSSSSQSSAVQCIQSTIRSKATRRVIPEKAYNHNQQSTGKLQEYLICYPTYILVSCAWHFDCLLVLSLLASRSSVHYYYCCTSTRTTVFGWGFLIRNCHKGIQEYNVEHPMICRDLPTSRRGIGRFPIR